MTCAGIAGTGNQRIPTDTKDRQAISESRYDMEKMCSEEFQKKCLHSIKLSCMMYGIPNADVAKW